MDNEVIVEHLLIGCVHTHTHLHTHTHKTCVTEHTGYQELRSDNGASFFEFLNISTLET